MPKVTVDPSEYVRVELKTAPPDGYVMLRPLPFGEKLKRRDKTSKMLMRTEQPNGGGGRGRMKAKDVNAVMEFESAQEWIVQHDFAYCIGEHNLQDASGNLLDFTSPVGWRTLDPRVGSEIEEAIVDINELPDEDDEEDFTKPSSTSTEELAPKA